jgi:hypothetical protein
LPDKNDYCNDARYELQNPQQTAHIILSTKFIPVIFHNLIVAAFFVLVNGGTRRF